METTTTGSTTTATTTTTSTTTSTLEEIGDDSHPTFDDIAGMILDKTGKQSSDEDSFVRAHEHHPPRHESDSSSLPQCERFPDTLIGRILPDTALEIDWDTIEDTVSEGLLPGGCWEPTTMDSEKTSY